MLDQERDNKDLDHVHARENDIDHDHDHLITEDHVVDHLITEIDHVHVQIQDEIIIIGIIIIIIHHQIKHQDIQIHIRIIMMKGNITIMLYFNYRDIMMFTMIDEITNQITNINLKNQNDDYNYKDYNLISFD